MITKMPAYTLSETGKAIRSKEFKKYSLVILAVSVLANLSIIAFRDYVYGTNDGTYGYNIVMFAGGFFWMPYYATIFVANMVFGKTYPDPYIKDRITKNLKRTHIYLGKLIASLIILCIYAVMTFLVFIGVSTLFHLSSGSLSAGVIKDFGINIMCATPLLLAGVSIGMMMLFIFGNKLMAYIAFWCVTIVIPRIVMILGAEPVSIGLCKFIKDKILITPQFTTLQFFASRNVPQIIVSSVIYIILTAMIGIIVFNRREIDNVPLGNKKKQVGENK
ncbi:MAG: hypothetical protein K6G03_03085 [Lachnospiraceae bacterium]|nr:hypothetical protein [Lachnospiraceae bacterium]